MRWADGGGGGSARHVPAMQVAQEFLSASSPRLSQLMQVENSLAVLYCCEAETFSLKILFHWSIQSDLIKIHIFEDTTDSFLIHNFLNHKIMIQTDPL
jgi:hypothetical protein